MSLISRLINKPAQVSLVREGETFFLKFLYDNRATTYAEVIDKWQELAVLTRYIIDIDLSSVQVLLNDLESLRRTLRELRDQPNVNKKLFFYISPDVEAIEFSTQAPDGYVIHYVRSGNSLVRMLPARTVELENGWTRLGNHYWRYEGLTDFHTNRFRRNTIDNSQIITFLTEDTKHYINAGLPIKCDISFSEKPAVELQIKSFTQTNVELRPLWHFDYHRIDETFILKDYVLVDNVVRPGLLPSEVHEIFPDLELSVTLDGMSAARFFDKQYVLLKKHLIGDLNGFESTFRWIEPPYHWILVARTQETRGIGRSFAYPYICIGSEEFSIGQLQEMLSQQYVRIQSGWVRKNDLLSLGLDENEMLKDGTVLHPIPLDAELLLHRGGEKIDTVFCDMRLEGAKWRDQGNKHLCVNDHLAFLMHWGVNGGISGGYESATAYGIPLVINYLRSHNDASVLILGNTEDKDALNNIITSISNATDTPPVLLSYDSFLSGEKATTRITWDLVCFIEPDVFLLSASSTMIQAVLSIKAACKIGFFLHAPSEDPEWTNLASTILGYPNEQELIPLLVRDSRNPKPLFEPYHFSHTQELAQENRSAGVIFYLEAKTSSQSIAQEEDRGIEIILDETKSERATVPSRGDAPIKVDEKVTAHSPEEEFFTEARRFVYFEEPEASHVPFSCNQPEYSDMNADQRRWYFYLRAQLRKGIYPETDLSYLYIFIYEILNQIGIKSPNHGLDMLMGVWTHYGTQYPQLSRHLGDWVFDYLQVYGLDSVENQLLWQVPELSVRGLNYALTKMAEKKETLRIPLWALEQLAQYSITSSQYYKNGDQSFIRQLFVEVVVAVDVVMHNETGQGILDTYAEYRLYNETVDAFSGALMESRESYPIRYRNYKIGLKLQCFLKTLIQYVEEGLFGYTKKCSNIHNNGLSRQIQVWVNYFFDMYLSSLVMKITVCLKQYKVEKSKRQEECSDLFVQRIVDSKQFQNQDQMLAQVVPLQSMKSASVIQSSQMVLDSSSIERRYAEESNEVRDTLLASKDKGTSDESSSNDDSQPGVRQRKPEVLSKPTERPSTTQPAGFTLDFDSVERLRAESDELRDTLLASKDIDTSAEPATDDDSHHPIYQEKTEVFSQPAEELSTIQPAGFTLDFDSVERLRAESVEVRDALLACNDEDTSDESSSNDDSQPSIQQQKPEVLSKPAERTGISAPRSRRSSPAMKEIEKMQAKINKTRSQIDQARNKDDQYGPTRQSKEAFNQAQKTLDNCQDSIDRAITVLRKHEEFCRRIEEQQQKEIKDARQGGTTETYEIDMVVSLLNEEALGLQSRDDADYVKVYAGNFPLYSSQQIIRLRKKTLPTIHDPSVIEKVRVNMLSRSVREKFTISTSIHFAENSDWDLDSRCRAAVEDTKMWYHASELEQLTKLLEELRQEWCSMVIEQLEDIKPGWSTFISAKRDLQVVIKDSSEAIPAMDSLFSIELRPGLHVYLQLNDKNLVRIFVQVMNVFAYIWQVTPEDVWQAAMLNPINDGTESGESNDPLVEEFLNSKRLQSRDQTYAQKKPLSFQNSHASLHSAKMVLDFDSVERLRAESDEVRDALRASGDGDKPDESSSNDDSQPSVQQINPEVLSRPTEESSASQPSGFTLDFDSVERLRAESAEVRDALLGTLEEERSSDDDSSEEEGPQRPVDQDDPNTKMPKPYDELARRTEAGETNTEWEAFFEQVQKRYGLDSLAALVKGPDTFIAFAKGHNKMPELLMDGFNEIATDTIGDLIADENGIFDDYLPEIRNHIRSKGVGGR